MPKLNATHISERLKEVIEQLESGVEVEAKKNKTLLNAEQQKALDDAWKEQQALRKKHKLPKTQEEKDEIGWKDKREVRIEIYKQAYAQSQTNAVDDIKELQAQRELKATKLFMDAWSKANKDGKDRLSAISAGNIAVTRAGFAPQGSVGLTKRDREMQKIEAELLKQMKGELSDDEKEQLEILREHEKILKKRKMV